jgi:hypothetical protein
MMGAPKSFFTAPAAEVTKRKWRLARLSLVLHPDPALRELCPPVEGFVSTLRDWTMDRLWHRGMWPFQGNHLRRSWNSLSDVAPKTMRIASHHCGLTDLRSRRRIRFAGQPAAFHPAPDGGAVNAQAPGGLGAILATSNKDPFELLPRRRLDPGPSFGSG